MPVSLCLSGCLFLFSYIYLWTLKEVHFICFVCMLHLYPMFFNTDDPCYIHTLKNNITKTPTCRFSHWFLSDQSQVQQPLQILLQTRVRQKMNLFLTLAVSHNNSNLKTSFINSFSLHFSFPNSPRRTFLLKSTCQLNPHVEIYTCFANTLTS